MSTLSRSSSEVSSLLEEERYSVPSILPTARTPSYSHVRRKPVAAAIHHVPSLSTAETVSFRPISSQQIVVKEAVSSVKPILDLPSSFRTKPFRTRRHRLGDWIWRQSWWPVELMSWLLSVLCFTAIAIILASFEGHPFPVVLRSGITLNTILSVLAVCGTFLLLIPLAAIIGQAKWIWFKQDRSLTDFELLDTAARGPVGSAILLTRMRGGLCAVLGACLTIVTLAINPFVQQAISYRDVSVMSEDAFMPTTRVYDALAHNITDALPKSWDGMVEPSMASVIVSTIYAPDQVARTVTPVCPGGNCSWPFMNQSYQSLALCSSCSDLTDQLHDDGSNILLPSGFGLVEAHSQDSNVTRVPLLNMTTLSATPVPLVRGNFSTLSKAHIYPSGPYDAVIVGGPYAFDIVANAVEPMAAQCQIEFCVQTLSAVEIDGIVYETILSSQPANVSLSNDDRTPIDQYGASTFTWFALNYFLGQTLTGWVVASGSGSSEVTSSVQENPTDWKSMEMNSIYRSMLDQKFNATDFAAAIAQSMSVNIRGIPDRIVTVLGVSIAKGDVVHVKWPWVALPLILATLTLLLAFYTILISRSHGIQPWRNSALATLFHGLDSSAMRPLGSLSRLDTMGEAARDIKVGLKLDQVEETGRWSLKIQ